MSVIAKLDDIKVYRESLSLAQDIYSLTRKDSLKREYSLIDQIRRSSLSIPANIAEGYGRRTKKDFAQFLSISLGSANETIAYLDFICMEYKIDISSLKEHYTLLTRKIYSLRTYLINK